MFKNARFTYFKVITRKKKGERKISSDSDDASAQTLFQKSGD
jgi:hypothetical protein